MISKELLSEVLEDNIKSIGSFNYPILEVEHIRYSYNEWVKWNIHEVAHKCKQWAYRNGYYLTIYNDAVDIVLKSSCKMIENITNDSFIYNQNLVFEACQWILDNKDEQC